MTKIEWTDETWNPVTGCTKVSAGCKNCYAERIAGRGIGSFTGGRKFTDVRTHADRLDAPLRWRKPRRVFVNSMSDLFHDDVGDDFIARVFTVMALAPQHTFQILTKRPLRMREWFALQSGTPCAFIPQGRGKHADLVAVPMPGVKVWPLPNVWLGVSCENQETADERVPLLLQTPAAVRFLSCEPLLGPILLDWLRVHEGNLDALHGERIDDFDTCGAPRERTGRIDWVIVGGESGPGARPCAAAWIRSLVEQCKAAGVACFVKQLGGYAILDPRYDRSVSGWTRKLRDPKGGDPDEWPEDLRVRAFPSTFRRGLA